MARIGGDDAVEFVRKTGLLGGGSWVAILAVVIALFLIFNCTTRVETGHVGVLTLFSKVDLGDTLPEGLHLINPLKSVHEMSVQTQSIKETASVPSDEGLMLSLDTTMIFHLDRSRAASVYQSVGTDYVEKIVEPNLRSTIRATTATHNANALYTGAREEVAQKIEDELKRILAPQGVVVESGLIGGEDIVVNPPADLKDGQRVRVKA